MDRRKLLLMGGPTWMLKGDGVRASVDIDFANGRAWSDNRRSAPASLLTCTRAISGTGHTYDYAEDASGNYLPFAANVPRITNKGLLVEEGRTNVVLQNRDLTQGAWNTVTNITAAKDQIGIDGTANGASSILATAGNAVITQGITLASSARFQTAFVRRLVGTGNVQMTMDGGTTWTTVTVTESWTRVSISTQTLANPVVGFRIVTSGDKIAVDAVQNENGAFSTSPILTTSAAVTRNADVVTMTSPPTFGSAYSLFATGFSNSPLLQTIFGISDGSTANRAIMYRGSDNKNGSAITSGSSGQTSPSTTGSWGVNVTGKTAFGVAVSNSALSFNGGTVSTAVGPGTMPSGINSVRLGDRGDGVSTTQWNGYITRAAIWPTARLSDTGLQRLST